MTKALRKLASLTNRIHMSYYAVVSLLYFRPRYLFLAFFMSVIFYEFVFWFLNAELFLYLLLSPDIDLLSKIELLASSYTEIFASPFSLLTFVLFVVSLVQGMAIAGIARMIRTERAHRGLYKQLGGTGLAAGLAVLGLGCVPCGTSIIAPILGVFVSGSTATLAQDVGTVASFLALIVSMLALYLVGKKLIVATRNIS